MAKAKIVKTIFQEIMPSQLLRSFRGVMIEKSGGNIFFHNHMGDSYRYSYPLVQYKLVSGHPAIVGINEGADALIGMKESLTSFKCRLGNEPASFNMAYFSEEDEELTAVAETISYDLFDWLPLNATNYKQFMNADGLVERIMLLERILTGNLLSMAKGLGIFFDSRIICRIDNFSYEGLSDMKGVGIMNFKVKFRSNLLIPDGIGIGKSASLNHGTILKCN